jgi:hypothetical protein
MPSLEQLHHRSLERITLTPTRVVTRVLCAWPMRYPASAAASGAGWVVPSPRRSHRPAAGDRRPRWATGPPIWAPPVGVWARSPRLACDHPVHPWKCEAMAGYWVADA